MSVTKWNGDTVSIEVSCSVCNVIRHESIIEHSSDIGTPLASIAIHHIANY